MFAIRCPRCGTRYRVPDHAAGKRTRCQQCGQPFRIPVPRHAAPPEEELRLADLTAIEAGGEPVEVPRPASNPSDAGAPAGSLGPSPTAGLPAVVEALPSAHPYRDYLRSIARSLAFPTRAGDLATALIMCAILIVGDVLAPFAPCVGALAQLVVVGWYMSFQFNVVLGAAAGEEELPTLAFTEGFWGDILAPLLKMLLTNFLVVLPATVFVVVSAGFVALAESAGKGNVSLAGVLAGHLGDFGTLAVGASLLLAGLFLWPMLVLVVAVGGVGGLLRVDLMVRTVIRSFPAYVIAVLAVYLCDVVEFIEDVLADIMSGGKPVRWAEAIERGLIFRIAAIPVELYVTIFAMRAVGLYYHHFKHRFAWSWG